MRGELPHRSRRLLQQSPGIIGQLATRFVRDIAADFGRPMPELTDSSFAGLAGHMWPGNGRELRNVVERALIFHDGGAFVVTPPTGRVHPLGEDGVVMQLGLTLEEVERRYLAASLEAYRDIELGQLSGQLGVSRKTLWDKRRRYGL